MASMPDTRGSTARTAMQTRPYERKIRQQAELFDSTQWVPISKSEDHPPAGQTKGGLSISKKLDIEQIDRGVILDIWNRYKPARCSQIEVEDEKQDLVPTTFYSIIVELAQSLEAVQFEMARAPNVRDCDQLRNVLKKINRVVDAADDVEEAAWKSIDDFTRESHNIIWTIGLEDDDDDEERSSRDVRAFDKLLKASRLLFFQSETIMVAWPKSSAVWTTDCYKLQADPYKIRLDKTVRLAKLIGDFAGVFQHLLCLLSTDLTAPPEIEGIGKEADAQMKIFAYYKFGEKIFFGEEDKEQCWNYLFRKETESSDEETMTPEPSMEEVTNREKLDQLKNSVYEYRRQPD